jgi:hypothetical protein
LNRLRCTDIYYTSNDEELDVSACVHVVEHNLLERLQKVFLEIKGHEFFSSQELIGKLP